MSHNSGSCKTCAKMCSKCKAPICVCAKKPEMNCAKCAMLCKNCARGNGCSTCASKMK